jgi:hypothetical protein
VLAGSWSSGTWPSAAAVRGRGHRQQQPRQVTASRSSGGWHCRSQWWLVDGVILRLSALKSPQRKHIVRCERFHDLQKSKILVRKLHPGIKGSACYLELGILQQTKWWYHIQLPSKHNTQLNRFAMLWAIEGKYVAPTQHKIPP